jgi:hypothetical protein
MNSSEEQFEALSQQIEQREQLARRRAWLVTLIPIILAVLFLTYTIWQIAQAEKTLAVRTSELSDVEKEIIILHTQLPEAQAGLSQAQKNVAAAQTMEADSRVKYSNAQTELANVQATQVLVSQQLATANADMLTARGLAPYSCSLSPERLKEFYGTGGTRADMLDYLFILQKRNVPWNLHGFSIEDGFDSPNFALFVLKNFNLVPSDTQPDKKPWDILPPTSFPSDGDIVYYDSGYTMFYYNIGIDPVYGEPIPCVIGMTPLGIQVLRIDFAAQRGALQVFR